MPAPHNADLLALVREHYSDVSQSYQDALYDTWTESKLRSFLLHHGIVAPQSKREELVLLAQEQGRKAGEYVDDVQSTVLSAYDAATAAPAAAYSSASSVASYAAGEAKASLAAGYAVVRDAPVNAYDYVVDGWKDAEMREWLVDNGYLKSDAELKSEAVRSRFSPSRMPADDSM